MADQIHKLKNGMVLVSTEVPAGLYNSLQLKTISSLCEGDIAMAKATEDQRIALFVKEDQIDHVVAELKKVGLGIRNYGEGLHSPVACVGDLCPKAEQNSLAETMAITETLATVDWQNRPPLKIGINSCATGCVATHTLDVSLVAGADGYRLSLGGKNSQIPELATLVADGIPGAELTGLLHKVITYYLKNSELDETLEEMIMRTGVSGFVALLAPYSQDAPDSGDPFSQTDVPAAEEPVAEAGDDAASGLAAMAATTMEHAKSAETTEAAEVAEAAEPAEVAEAVEPSAPAEEASEVPELGDLEAEDASLAADPALEVAEEDAEAGPAIATDDLEELPEALAGEEDIPITSAEEDLSATEEIAIDGPEPDIAELPAEQESAEQESAEVQADAAELEANAAMEAALADDEQSEEAVAGEASVEEAGAEEASVEEAGAEEAGDEDELAAAELEEIDLSGLDEEVSEEPALEEALAEEPVAEEPVAEEPVAEEPALDEALAEESIAEEPALDEALAEESIAEEPALDEALAEEPAAEEPVAEEPALEEALAEEPVAEEPVLAEEPALDEALAEEPVAEEQVAEEPVAEEPPPEEDLEADLESSIEQSIDEEKDFLDQNDEDPNEEAREQLGSIEIPESSTNVVPLKPTDEASGATCTDALTKVALVGSKTVVIEFGEKLKIELDMEELRERESPVNLQGKVIAFDQRAGEIALSVDGFTVVIGHDAAA